MKDGIRFLPAGDSGLLIQWDQEISPEITGEVRSAHYLLQHAMIEGIVDLVPAYCSLLVIYDPGVIQWNALQARIRPLLMRKEDVPEGKERVFEIPVCYGGSYGEDMARVMKHTGFSEEEIIRRHTSREYLVYMIGFMPGFPYLGELDETLAVPRLEKPRLIIPAGSVGIGGAQTGIYPSASPGGWNLIGRTPVRIYDPSKEQPVLFRAGDRIRFVSITEERFLALSRETGGYRLKEGDSEWVSV